MIELDIKIGATQKITENFGEFQGYLTYLAQEYPEFTLNFRDSLKIRLHSGDKLKNGSIQRI